MSQPKGGLAEAHLPIPMMGHLSGAKLLAFAAAFISVTACSAPPNEQPASSKAALSVSAARTFGFESLDDWSPLWSTPQLSLSPVHSEGQSSLSFGGGGWMQVQSRALSKEAPPPQVVGYDVRVPSAPVNPWWYGNTELSLDAPSAGIHGQHVGHADLTGFPKGQFKRVEFEMPKALIAKLNNNNYSDLRLRVVINVERNETAAYLVDHFTFGPATPTCTPQADGNPCTKDECVDGQPSWTPLPTGSACSNGNRCDGDETCDATANCVANASPTLDDANPCTVDACDPASGVTHTNVAIGTSCDADGNVCNGTATCDAAAQCNSAPAPSIDDANPCTTDSCSPMAGPVHTPVANGTACSDGDACTQQDKCAAGTCQPGTATVCVAPDKCHSAGTCDSATGQCSATTLPQGTPCSDGNACNGLEVCDASGACTAGTSPIVDDGNPCTADACSPTTGVVHVAVAAGTSCSNGNACDGAEACDGAGTCTPGPAPVVDDNNPCTADSCSGLGGVAHAPIASGSNCSDNNACNGTETCDGLGACRGGAAPALDDNNPCTVDACDAVAGVTHQPATSGTACDDNSLCNGREQCDGAGTCRPGTALAVDDSNPCTADACDPAKGVSHTPAVAGTSCSNGNACDGTELCDAVGHCQAGTPLAVDDGNQCTADSCDPASGVHHSPVAVGTTCHAGACLSAGACDNTGICRDGPPLDIDDANPCTVDTCDAQGGVQHQPVAAGTSCADGNVCNGQELCSVSGKCDAGVAPPLDDGNPCTIDACDAQAGVSHRAAPLGQACDDSDLCNGRETCSAVGTCVAGLSPELDDGDECTADKCTPQGGVTHAPWPNGFPCADDNACNGEETCNGSGQCVSGTPPTADDNNPCTVDSCDADLGVRHVAAASGTACAAADACHGAGACDAVGHCQIGAVTATDDNNPCTADSCDPVAGVKHSPVATGTACPNGNACDGQEACDAQGSCIASTPPTLDDGNPCTADACDPKVGVTHTAVALGTSCSDGNACNGDEACSAAGTCAGGPAPSVDDGNPCTVDACDQATGVTHRLKAAGTSCSDGNACNGVEACTADGACTASGLPNLSDNNPCTDDSCDPLKGVQHLPRATGSSCADASVCNGQETCSADGSCQAGVPLTLDDANPCTVDSCDPATGAVHTAKAAGTDCSDGNVCNGSEACSPTGQCSSGAAPQLSDNNPCTDDSCDTATGVHHVARAAGSSCSDGNLCNGAETCTAQGACVAGTLPDASDGNPCTVDSCQSGAFVHTPAPNGTSCSDGNTCNGAEQCQAGTCQAGQAPSFDDANPCTIDACSSSSGAITHTAVATGTACDNGTVCDGRETCDAGGTCKAGVAPTLDDSNPCTADACSAVTGVSHVPLSAGTACDDGTLCNGRETCDASGTCKLGIALIVDDGNPCTTDTCSALTGAQHTAVAAGTSCSDSNPCNGVEACSASGVCMAGSAPAIDDGNPCTVDSCSSGGVQHTAVAVGTSCPDQNACNGAETCNALGVCVAGATANVDDGNACTADSCDPLSGVTHVPLTTPECQTRAGWFQLPNSQPSPRDAAAGAFIGTGELLLFGGDNAGAVLGDAWLWSPASRSWRRAASGPTARAGATLAYDSQRKVAVLFGGVDGSLATAAYLNDIWEYDASTDKWTQRIASGGAPPGRALAAFAVDASRGRAVLFGGTGASALSDTWEWNATQGTWTQLAATGPVARYGAAFAFDQARGTYALFGGSPGNASGALDDTWTLNATSGVWQRLSPTQKPPARAGAALAFDATAGRFVLVGGNVAPNLRIDDTWELSATDGTWQQLVVDRTPTSDTGGVLGFDTQANKLTYASGLSYSATGVFTPQSSAVWQLDRPAGRWTDRVSRETPTDLRLGAAFDSGRQAIVALGSVVPPGRPLMWAFDPRTGQWSAQDLTDIDHPFSIGAFDSPLPGAANLIYSAPLARLISAHMDELYQFDGSAWSQRCKLSRAPTAPYRLVASSVAFDAASQRLYETGGVDSGVAFPQRNRQVVRIDLTTCAEDIVPLTTFGPDSLDDPVAVWDSNRGRLIQFGGSEFIGFYNYRAETWELDPIAGAWTRLFGQAPPGRSKAAAVYDPARRRVILHGGTNEAGPLFDTWELDPEAQAWTQLSTTGPSAGEQATLVFDEVRQAPALVSTRGAVWHLVAGKWLADLNPVVPSARSGMSGGWSPLSGLGLFFGGTSGDGQRDFLGDLWIWRDGWRGVYPGSGGSSQIASGQGTGVLSDVPVSRTGHVFATGFVENDVRHMALLFGGEGGSDLSYGLLPDTWAFDESTMTWRVIPRLQNTDPRGRTGHAISFVPRFGYLMFGGLGRDKFQVSGGVYEQRNVYFDETWLWSPSSWRQLGKNTAPSPRYGHAMVTDESTNEIILFGGRTADSVSNETWAISLSGIGLAGSANWRKLSPATSPLGRFGHSMAYDPVRRKVILTGGEGASPSQTFGDTWEWDSSTQTWTARNVQPLEGRVGHVTFYDRTRSQLIAFGGFAHRDGGQFALSYGDTLAFIRPTDADPQTGLGNGSRCTGAGACASGNCVDGFCCNSTCTGQCGACDVAGFEGTCKAVAGAPHGARPTCSGGGTGECAIQCNGTDVTQCNSPPTGTACGAAAPSCAGDNLITGAGTCDAAGHTCVLPQTSCGAYTCCDGVRCGFGAPQCMTLCQGSDTLCAAGYKCSSVGTFNGVCYKPTKITSFTSSPATPKVGVQATFTVVATEATTKYQYNYKFAGGSTVFPTCSGSTCSWTPVAADAGKSVTWTVNVGANPSTNNFADDSKSLTLTVSP